MITLSELEQFAAKNESALIAINPVNQIVILNPAAADLFHVPSGEFLGQDVTKLIPETLLPQTRDSGTFEFNKLYRVGSRLFITSRMPYRDETGSIAGAVAFFRDVMEHEELSAQVISLQEVRILLTAIINSTQDAISVVDEKGTGLMINPAYTRLTGLSEKDVLGQPPTVDIAEGESMHMKVLRTGQPVKGVSMKVGPKRKEVIVDVAPIIVGEKLRGSVGVLHDVSEIRKLSEELEGARSLIRHLEAKYTFSDISCENQAMRKVIEQAQRAARTPATVLLRGESGTGKELFAHAIHHASGRRGKFIRVNCASISDSLLESELFGYVDGAFTGARRGGKEGFFAEADGGTILLDEIGEISLSLQAKLLRVLQEKEIIKVGDNKSTPVDVRVIAATNADLEAKIEAGAFREDLYYRLNVIPLFILPLRERISDLPLLVAQLLRRLNQEYGRCVAWVSESVMLELLTYHWPGNVRELENVLGRAMINMQIGETVIESEHLPVLQVRSHTHARARTALKDHDLIAVNWAVSFQEMQHQWEKAILIQSLKKAGGNKTIAAETLKIPVRTYYYKLKKHGLA